MGKETSERIQTSVLNAAEKKVLVWLAQRQPAWVTSDFLTYTGVVGALVCAVGFVLAHIDKNYLWISSLGLVINWYGDSLDGTLARVRNAQNPFMDFLSTIRSMPSPFVSCVSEPVFRPCLGSM